MTSADEPSPAPWVRLPCTVRIELRREATEDQKRRFNTEFLTGAVLKDLFKVKPTELFSLLDFTRAGVMDVSFFNQARCKKFVGDWLASGDARLGGIRLRPLYAQDTVSVTVTMFNPYFREDDILTYLRQRCAAVKGGTKVPHPFGCWSGKRRYACKLKADPRRPGEFIHLPGNFSIGANRGLLSYPGQPQFCWKCGAEGHGKEDCVGPRCRFCGSGEHLAAACTAPRTCSLCGDGGHLFARCPQRKVSYADVVSGESAVGAVGEDGRQPSAGQRQRGPHGQAVAPEGPLLAVDGSEGEVAASEAAGAPPAGTEGECTSGDEIIFEASMADLNTPPRVDWEDEMSRTEDQEADQPGQVEGCQTPTGLKALREESGSLDASLKPGVDLMSAPVPQDLATPVEAVLDVVMAGTPKLAFKRASSAGGRDKDGAPEDDPKRWGGSRPVKAAPADEGLAAVEAAVEVAEKSELPTEKSETPTATSETPTGGAAATPVGGLEAPQAGSGAAVVSVDSETEADEASSLGSSTPSQVGGLERRVQVGRSRQAEGVQTAPADTSTAPGGGGSSGPEDGGAKHDGGRSSGCPHTAAAVSLRVVDSDPGTGGGRGRGGGARSQGATSLGRGRGARDSV